MILKWKERGRDREEAKEKDTPTNQTNHRHLIGRLKGTHNNHFEHA